MAGYLGNSRPIKRILYRFGFRSVLFWNALIASFSMGLCVTFTPTTAPVVMICIILLGGVFRTLQFTGANTLAFADVEPAEMSHATSLSQMAQRIAQSIGIAAAAALLRLFSGGAATLTTHAFAMSFIVIALISALSCLSFFSLSKTAGDVLAGRETERERNLT